jgi:RHS repeat-associated protein
VQRPRPDRSLRTCLQPRYWYEVDAQGSVMALTDVTGNGVDQYQYDAWGAPDMSEGGNHEDVPQPLWYRGYVEDRELQTPGENGGGWYWLSVRSYDPTLERFIQPDPSEQDGTRSYVYCGDDPLDCSDPSGLAGSGLCVAVVRASPAPTVAGGICTRSRRAPLKRRRWPSAPA